MKNTDIIQALLQISVPLKSYTIYSKFYSTEIWQLFHQHAFLGYSCVKIIYRNPACTGTLLSGYRGFYLVLFGLLSVLVFLVFWFGFWFGFVLCNQKARR